MATNATYSSPYVLRGSPVRPTAQSEPMQVTRTVTIPDGVGLVSSDVIKFATLGENVIVTDVELRMDKFDSNATATLAGKLGTSDDDDCFIGAGVIQTNTSGAKTISKEDGAGTQDNFNVSPYVVSADKQDVILTITANPATSYKTGARQITLLFDVQYKYPFQFVSGIDNVSTTNLLGDKTYSPADTYDYNGNAQ